MFDWEGEHRYAKYSSFNVAPESDNYRVRFSGYTGNAGGDAFGEYQNGAPFTTIDRDNDAWSDGNCAARYGGHGGFWWRDCGDFTPNARYSHISSVPNYWGIHWRQWRRVDYSLKAVSMAFRATSLDP